MTALSQALPVQMEIIQSGIINVWNRNQIEKGLGRGGVLISILQGKLTTPWSVVGKPDGENRTPISDKSHWRKILSLRFDDITKEEQKSEIFVLFDESHADKIWDFVRDVDTDEVINIHCAAGISRSVAVGVVLADSLGRDLIIHTGVDSRFMNHHVSAVLKRRMWKEHFDV